MATRKPVVDAPPLPTRAQWQAYVDAQIAANPQWVPPNQVCVEDISDWQQTAQLLSRTKAAEMIQRQRIFSFLFPAPEEGTNNVKLADGTLVKAGYKINRDVDEALLAALTAPNPDLDGKSIFEVGGVNPAKLIKYEPALIIGEYRELTQEQRLLFERALVMKPGAASLELVPPKASA